MSDFKKEHLLSVTDESVAPLTRGWLNRRPAVLALLIQFLVLVVQILLWYLLHRQGVPLAWTPVRAAIIQSVAAAWLSWWLDMPVWWWWIQLGFPWAVLWAPRAGIPPVIYLLALLTMLPWYWHTFSTRVPYYPSDLTVWQAVAELLPTGQPRVLEIGSGLGGFAIWLAKVYPQCVVSGVELAPMPWLISRFKAWRQGARVHFMRCDYHHLDWKDVDLVYAYLSPAAMPDVWQIAKASMRPGSLLVSYEFIVPNVPPDRIIRTAGMRKSLYAWYI